MTLAAPPPLDPQRDALLLDFDGTFVDFAPHPDAITLRPGSRDLLLAVRSCLGGALAIVTGRRIADIDRFLAPLCLPAVGLHGQESRFDGEDISSRPPTPDIGEARRRLAAHGEFPPGLMIEDKGAAIVLHYRTRPELKEDVAALGRAAVAGLAEIHAVAGHDIVEIRQRGVSKAEAPRMLAAAGPFAGRRPVFIGDDTTDEDGFRAAAAAGGFGIKVGPGDTAAAYRLPDVGAVHRWLASCASGVAGTSMEGLR